jgi:PAS domain S-box-containing protein
MRRVDGEYRWHLVRRAPLRDENGEVIKWYAVGIDIEDKKRAEAALRESEARLAAAKRELEATIDTVPALVASYEPDGSRDFVNRPWRDYTGISQEQAKGKSWSITVHSEDFDAGEREWRASLATGRPFEMEQRFRRTDGEYRWHVSRRVPLRDDNGNGPTRPFAFSATSRPPSLRSEWCCNGSIRTISKSSNGRSIAHRGSERPSTSNTGC